MEPCGERDGPTALYRSLYLARTGELRAVGAHGEVVEGRRRRGWLGAEQLEERRAARGSERLATCASSSSYCGASLLACTARPASCGRRGEAEGGAASRRARCGSPAAGTCLVEQAPLSQIAARVPSGLRFQLVHQAAGRTGPEPGERGDRLLLLPAVLSPPSTPARTPISHKHGLSARALPPPGPARPRGPVPAVRVEEERRLRCAPALSRATHTHSGGSGADSELSQQAPRAWSPALSLSRPRPASRSFGWAATRRKQVRLALSSRLRVVRRGSMRRWIRCRWRAEGPAHSSLRKEADPVLLLLPHQPSPSLRPST